MSCLSHTVGALCGSDGPSWGVCVPPAVCHPVVTLECGGGPAPDLCGSLTRLFPRYVQEVIQRGRSCIRPACTPVLSVVPAVSDMELSETEYVRAPRGSSCSAYPARAVGQVLRSSSCSQGGSLGTAQEELGLPAVCRPFLPVSPSKGMLTIHVVANDQQAREKVHSVSSILATHPRLPLLF